MSGEMLLTALLECTDSSPCRQAMVTQIIIDGFKFLPILSETARQNELIDNVEPIWDSITVPGNSFVYCVQCRDSLFTSTEDGCTFQMNPNSSVNPEHLSYFRFVGRIMGDSGWVNGFVLDAHFTGSFYKHMAAWSKGIKPTESDMEAIGPDHHKNHMILKHNLDDISHEPTFSIEDFSFGGQDIVDLIPNGGRKRQVCEFAICDY
eukprot:CAMPEP_0202507670 /NCGR_PEP_ID=MMETSP1361-20130828/51849_1 /ASSEMBLY_ACC=CAM_ASM_000849 /TAXON_ID=210615 /ORGANISM="Staurosira complex sp., Strain CCMP2646" /LENGTH=205 /DNA_ID=CAMNT_0049141811 /DNA_START=940 /DNA_END=1560 /DNA_ORIENTATION=-